MPGESELKKASDDEVSSKTDASACAGNQAYDAMLKAAFSQMIEPERLGDYNKLKAEAPCLKNEQEAISKMNDTLQKGGILAGAYPEQEIELNTKYVEKNPSKFGPIEGAQGPITVNGESIPADTTYVRIKDFMSQNGANVLADFLAKDNGQGKSVADSSKSFVIDLRDNVGGTITQLESVASLFMKDANLGKIVGRNQDAQSALLDSSIKTQNLEHHEKAEELTKQLSDKEIVVLINGRTAGSAEILAEALREHRQAKIVGSPSYGLGDVYSAQKIGKAVMTFPVGKLYDSAGKWFGDGVLPNIQIDGVSDAKSLKTGNPSNEDLQLRKAIEILRKP